MDLPIAPARMLGLGQGAGQSAIEAALSRRLIPPAWGSFSSATLRARAAWLQHAADGLRQRPAPAPTGGPARLALLLLLLEAGEAHSVFEQARAMALRLIELGELPSQLDPLVRDLHELLEHACRSAAAALHRQRRFEAEDQLLAEAEKLLNSPLAADRKRAIERDRRQLVPYRILDLLSRDLADQKVRSAGLELLDTLVQRRGGLEGGEESVLDRAGFEAFLAQIRSFMTLQEWIDCCERWHRQGDAAAGELLAAGLVASGFQQRKPERIDRALQLLEAADPPPQDQVLAWLHLLLGEVDRALALDPADAADAGTERLGRLCAQCQRWLGRSLLPGYRDSDGNVDLEAWFEDREVMAYLEKRDRGVARSRPRQPAGNTVMAEVPASGETGSGPDQAADLQPLPSRSASRSRSIRAAERSQHKGHLPIHGAAPVAYMLLGACLSLGVQNILRPRQDPGSPPRGGPPPAPAARPGQPAEHRTLPPAGMSFVLPFVAADPSRGQMAAFLQEWLDAKGGVLAGRSPRRPLRSYATEDLVEAVNLQHRQATARGFTQHTLARVEGVDIVGRQTDRLRIEARIRYADETLTRDGAVINRTPLMRLRNTYTFRRDDGAWKLEEWSQTEAGTPLPSLGGTDPPPLDPNPRTSG